MANFDPQLVQPTLTAAPTALSGTGPSGGSSMSAVAGDVQPHHSVIALVLFSALAIFALDKAGFRFSVTTGKR